MANVMFGLKIGSKGHLDRYGWAEKQALLKVTGLGFVSGKDDLCYKAVLAIDAAGYTYGSVHPTVDTLFMLGPRTCRVISSSAVDVEVTYRRKEKADPDYVDIRGDIVLVQERTNKDKDGNDIVLEWKPEAARTAKTQTGMIDRWLPSMSLEFSKTIETNPAPVAKTLVGFLNGGTFQGDEPGQWLCMGCPFHSPDGGVHWETSFKFAHNDYGWKQTVYYILDSGRPPANYNAAYNEGKTVKTIEVYGEADFDQLGLPNAMS